MDQVSSQKVDEDLINDCGFCFENLMELAGLSVAHAAHYINKKYLSGKVSKIFIIAGPGSIIHWKK